MFRIGTSVGRNDVNVEGHLQMVYNYNNLVETQPVQPQEEPPNGEE